MQNQILQHKLLDNTADTWMAINPTKQQFFVLPKEESQMMQGRSAHFTGNRPAGYTNDPMNESENRDDLVNQTSLPYASSFTETDYMGMSIYTLPHSINSEFAQIKVYDPVKNFEEDLYKDTDESLRTIRPGLQMFRIPRKRFNEELTDPDQIKLNGGSNIKPHYGTYIITIAPMYIDCNVLDIQPKAHYSTDKMGDNIDATDPLDVKPKYKRRTVYECDNSNFFNTPWAFENDPKQAGRLIGSVVEVWNATKTELKQMKVIGENDFHFDDQTKNLEMVFYPDNFGYDTPSSEIVVGDVIRVYPRETSFDQILVQVSYEDAKLQVEQVMQFLMNDVVRDMANGIYEVYDKDGFAVDQVTGNFDGKVIHRYQIFQQGKYECRKKLKKNG